MTEPTPAERRAVSRWNSHIAALYARHCPCADKFRADVERLEAAGESHIAHILELERIALHWIAQRDAAVTPLQEERHWSVAIRATDSWHEINLQDSRCDCPGHKRIEELRDYLKDHESFLSDQERREE